MEFWGTEVAAGKPEVCQPGDEMYCHVSQAALGPSTNGKMERVILRVETGGKDVVLGTLSSGKCDQMALDLIFDREFKLSHTGTSCSVYFCGYKTEKGEPEEYNSEEEDEEESEDDGPVPVAVSLKENGDAKKSAKKANKVELPMAAVPFKGKASKSLVKQDLIDDEADEDDSEESDDEEDELTQMNPVVMDFDSDDSDEEDDSEFEGDGTDDSDDEDELDEEDDSDDDDESDEEMVLTPEVSKKRPLKGEVKSPVGGKKARTDTPAKPGSQTAAEYWESLIIAGSKGLIASPGKKDKSAAKAAATLAKEAKTPVAASKKSEAKEAKTPQKTPGKEVSMKTPKTATKTTAKPAAPTPASSTKKLSGLHKCEECNRFSFMGGRLVHQVAY